MLSIKLVGDREVIARFREMPSKMRGALVRKVTALRLKLEAHIKNDKLSGQVLKVQTGNLRASIFSQTIDEGDTIIGRAASSGDVKYAGIHEFGGVIEHPGGTPYMMIEGKTVFVSKMLSKNLNLPVTAPHSIPMPERSFMRSSLADMREEIVDGMTQAVKGAAAEK